MSNPNPARSKPKPTRLPSSMGRLSWVVPVTSTPQHQHLNIKIATFHRADQCFTRHTVLEWRRRLTTRPVLFFSASPLRFDAASTYTLVSHAGIGVPMLFDLAGPADRNISKPAFQSLLLSCRTIYGEASALLYSANRFVVHYSHDAQQSLQPLRNLTASSLAALTRLNIVLNQTSCHHWRYADRLGSCCEETYCKAQHVGRHDLPLQSGHSAAGPLLDEWLQTAELLSLGISPRALQLSLVCDLDEQEPAGMATKITTPLSLLPELKGCHIRLCRAPNAHLGQIAQRAALQACSRPEPSLPHSSSSRHLLSLPRELRLRILEYTDLVTPWMQVAWSRVERGYLYPGATGCAWPRPPCQAALHHGCQFSRCYQQNRVKDGILVYSDAIGCFCRVYHAAFSSSCRCWAPPTPLFLVCHALSEDAKFAFFSLNRFVINDSLASSLPYCAFDLWKVVKMPTRRHYWDSPEYIHAQPPRSYPADRFAASQFLREVVPAGCLSYLRFIEIAFPPYNHACWPHDDDHPALQDWVATIDWAKDKLNTRGLTLRLTMAGSLLLSPQHPDERRNVTQAQGDQVLASYDRILKPLARLGSGEDGFARFYADFAWPWEWVRPVYDGHRELVEYEDVRMWFKSKEDVLNERAGRLILGDDRYERLRLDGPPEEMPWTLHFMQDY